MKNILWVFVSAILFCTASNAQTNERQTQKFVGSVKLEKPASNTVWAIDFVKTNDGRQADFLKFIEQNWAKPRQTLKDAGKITSFQVLSLQPGKNVEWDVLLLTEYANTDAHDKREQLFAEVFKTQPIILINGASGGEMREIKFSRVFTEPISSEIARAMLQSQTANPEIAAARVPLENYLKGHETGGAEFMRKAFHTTGNLIFIRDGKFTTLTFDEYIARSSGKPAPDEANRKRFIESLEVSGNVGFGKIVLDYPTVRFVDYMSLLKIDGEWKIVNKTFYAEPKPQK